MYDWNKTIAAIQQWFIIVIIIIIFSPATLEGYPSSKVSGSNLSYVCKLNGMSWVINYYCLERPKFEALLTAGYVISLLRLAIIIILLLILDRSYRR